MELFFRGIKLKLYPSVTEYWSIKKKYFLQSCFYYNVMRFYRRVKCLTAVSLLFLALDNCSAVIKMIPPSFTSYCTKPVLLVPKQNISHRCYRGFKEKNSGLNWTCDCGYSTLLLEIKVMLFFFPPISYSALQRHTAQRRAWTQVKCLPLSVASSWVMS